MKTFALILLIVMPALAGDPPRTLEPPEKLEVLRAQVNTLTAQAVALQAQNVALRAAIAAQNAQTALRAATDAYNAALSRVRSACGAEGYALDAEQVWQEAAPQTAPEGN